MVVPYKCTVYRIEIDEESEEGDDEKVEEYDSFLVQVEYLFNQMGLLSFDLLFAGHTFRTSPYSKFHGNRRALSSHGNR
jgi:hypothetical protein